VFWTIVKLALTSGIRSAMPNPASTSCVLTCSMTPDNWMLRAPSWLSWRMFDSSPCMTATSCSCAVRLASSQTVSNWSLSTTLDVVLRTKFSTPPVIEPSRRPNAVATRSRPWSSSAPLTVPTTVGTSIFSMMASVVRPTSAD